ncbi:MAG: VCBS repeat-containing protein [Nocardioidaceae bacterium]|nr:VCBS repeat-containing protein [Nocardioidaceae bacterium]
MAHHTTSRWTVLLTSGGLLAATALASAAANAAPVKAPTAAAEGDLVAVDRAPKAGLNAKSRTYSASAVDFDRDGDQDVLIGYHAQTGKLWRNRGAGTYRRVATSAWPKFNANGRTIDRHDCAWADVDRNGRPDAYCSTGRFTHNVVKHDRDNELWLQSRQGRFREVGTDWRVGDVCGRGRQVTFLDANGDRFPDLFVGNDRPRKGSDPCNKAGNHLPNERSKLYINTGGTGFRHARRYWDFGSGPGTRCAEVLDFDRDGWDDLLACRPGSKSPRLYRNKRGHGFADVTSKHLLRGRVTDAVVGDLDGDRDPDLITATPDGFAYHLNNHGRFAPRVWIGSVSAGKGRSVAVGDADSDGDLDVYGMVGSRGRFNPDDKIWFNDALSFTPLSVPSAGGAADDVVALNRLGDGRAEFLVLNGAGWGETPPGPVQLIRVVRQ